MTRAEFGMRTSCSKKVHINKPKHPILTDLRTQSISSLYTYRDFLIDLIRHYTIKQGVYYPHLPTLIVDYVPLYTWLSPGGTIDTSEQKEEEGDDLMKVELSHCDTIICNSFQKFGAVLGSKLDPRLDHVINIQLVEGVEFGFGICDESHLTKITKRDFMCMEGGYGYYNYKTKSSHLKAKYPPGFYYQEQDCQKSRAETDLISAGDVLTMVIQRENVKTPGGGINSRSRFGIDRDLEFNPMENLEASSRFTLSFYKNGEDMGFHLRNLKGQLSICLNYYFVDSKIRLLSDYKFKKIFNKRIRRPKKQMLQTTDLTYMDSYGFCHRRDGSVPSGSDVNLRSLMISDFI